ncbi:hypothetical protein EV426DRAFT_187990 [Tirmania nivea]|nr:hypothetical protein EV426DRAFT_187990 [Tirmania nivea]
MATPATLLTTALLLSASAVNGFAIYKPLDATTKSNDEAYDIPIATIDDHHQPLATSELPFRLSAQDPIRVCITVGENPDGTKHQICAENPKDLCYDPVWSAVPRPANALPWCAPETSTELKAKRLVARQGSEGTSMRRRKVERSRLKVPGSEPGPKALKPGDLLKGAAQPVTPHRGMLVFMQLF